MVRIDDAVEAGIVVVEKLAEFDVYLFGVWLSDHLAIVEVGEGGHAVFGDDIVRLGFVADGDADFVCPIFGAGMLQDGEFYSGHLCCFYKIGTGTFFI